MSEALEREIAALPEMNIAQLRAKWRQRLKEAPPSHVRKQLFVPILAYKLQEQAYGGLRPEIRRQLEKIAGRYRQDPNAKVEPIREPKRIKPGTRLLRQWNGKTHQVSGASEKRATDAEVIPSERNSLAEVLCGNRPEIGPVV